MTQNYSDVCVHKKRYVHLWRVIIIIRVISDSWQTAQ